MPGFGTIGAWADAYDAGRAHFCAFRKAPSQATVAGWWADLSMTSGNPVPNYYAASPLEASVLDGSRGIFHGDDKSPGVMHLASIGLVTPTAGLLGRYMLLDYLLFYPFVDGDDLDTQAMVNDIALSRYTDGAGVMVMAVCVAPSTGAGKFTFTYVNQDGVERTSPVQSCSTTASGITSIVTSQPAVAGMPGGPFLALASGDTGVRSIVSVQHIVANGGLVALVLVKPLCDLAIREINTTAERHFITQHPAAPRIYDGAYLGLITNCAGSIAAGTLTGFCNFVWSE